jgi:hypothetical protein
MNPRMEYFDESQSGDANKASLLSLINDTINRTPMDLIQVRPGQPPFERSVRVRLLIYGMFTA